MKSECYEHNINFVYFSVCKMIMFITGKSGVDQLL